MVTGFTWRQSEGAASESRKSYTNFPIHLISILGIAVFPSKNTLQALRFKIIVSPLYVHTSQCGYHREKCKYEYDVKM